MDSRVDFAMDSRSRLLASNLPPGTLGPMTSYGNDLNRAGVAELARTTTTPATMSMTSLAQYQSRFLPSTMSMHSPGASFALMGGFLGGATPADNLKTLMPDMQQFWAPHSDGYPRFVINNAPYTPFGPFLPTDTLPSLLPPAPSVSTAPGPAHCHRIYELQKDAFLASVAASQTGFYGIVPNGHPYLERAASPLQQAQVHTLPLVPVKQEPREAASSCQGSSSSGSNVSGHDRPTSRSWERRQQTSTPRQSSESGRSAGREQHLQKDSSATGVNINNNNTNIVNNNTNSNTVSGGSSGNRSQSAHRISASRASASKAVDKKDVLKGSAQEHHLLPTSAAKDKRLEPTVKPNQGAGKQRAAVPMVDKAKVPVGSGLVLKSDSSKHPEVAEALKAAKFAHTTKSLTTTTTNNNNPPQERDKELQRQKLPCGKELQQKVPCNTEFQQKVSGNKVNQQKVSCSKDDQKVSFNKEEQNVSCGSNKAEQKISSGSINQGDQKVSCGTNIKGDQKVSCSGREQVKVSAAKGQQKVSCNKEASGNGRPFPASQKVHNCGADSKICVDPSAGKARDKKGDEADSKHAPEGRGRVNEKGGDNFTTSSAVSADISPGVGPASKHPKSGHNRDGVGGGVGGGGVASMDKRVHLSGTASAGSDVRSKGLVSPATPACSLTKKSIPISAATTSNAGFIPANLSLAVGSSPQVVPTLVTVTSTSCDVSTVTSVPVTSGGTQSVFARSQPVASTGACVTAASPAQLKSNSSVTSQVATSALPYYHTLYSKSEDGQEGAAGAKRVHATTTFVPEVGTFKGPLIRNMSKGCPESKTVKSEPSRASQGSNPGERSGGVGSVGDAQADRSEGSYGEGSDDEASDFFQLSPHSQHDSSTSRTGGRLPYDDPHSNHEHPRRSTPSGGSVCSSGRSSVPFSGSRGSSVGFQQTSENSPDVALDFSMAKRPKEFNGDGQRRCPEERKAGKSRSDAGVSAGKGMGCDSHHGHVGTTTASSASSVPSVCGPVQRMDQRDGPGPSSMFSAASSLQMTQLTFSGYTASRLSPAIHPPIPVPPAESEPNAALNLSKSIIKKKSRTDAAAASFNKKSAAGCSEHGGVSGEAAHHVTGSGSRVSRSAVSKKKRCGSAPPPSSLLASGAEMDDGEGEDGGEEEEEKQVEEQDTSASVVSEDKESTDHVASNIPVGIAVAQQRADAGRVDTRTGGSRADLHLRTSEAGETSRQLTHDVNDREEFLRQQKSLLTGAAKPIPNTALPPNLVVTGGENTLTDDMRLRPLANQWLSASHGLAANPWLPQNPFTIHPAIPTSGAGFDPNHHPAVPIPGGFKLAQNPLTGQILIIPSGDLVDQNTLWSAFQSGASSQAIPPAFPPLAVPLSQHAAVTAATSAPTTTDTHEHAQAGENENTALSVESGSVCEEEASEGPQTPGQPQQPTSFGTRSAAVTTAVSVNTTTTANNNNVSDSPQKTDGVNLNSSFVSADLAAHSLALQAAAAAAGIATPQFPFVFNPALLSLPPGLAVGEPLSIKTEPPAVQSRGCSPIVMSPSPSLEEAADDQDEASAKARGTEKKVRTACVSVQTCADLDQPAVTSPTPAATPVKSTSSKEQGIQTSLGDHLQPLSVICGTSDFSILHKDSAPLGALAAAALVVGEDKAVSMAAGASANRNIGGVNYNPFTDPQILQAADGLELLSTLAEKRPKCSSAALVDPKAVFPSPSDSFKSDTPLPCPELEEASSLGEGERSGGTTPRGDKPRDVSPKWASPAARKEAGRPANGGDFKLSSDPGLANVDAIEMNIRIRLAELQHQYREKQLELAKLQPKKDKEADSVKRGRGRPRKRQFVSGKKYDDESSNSSGGKTTKDGCSVKRRRPAEELVDRVFRKFPPAKLGTLKMKSISFKHKRRSSHSSISIDTGGTKDSGKKKDKHRHDTGNLFSNMESSFKDSGKKKAKRESEIPSTVTSALSQHTPTTITPVTLESGLGLLAKFATTALTTSSSPCPFKRKTDDCSWDVGPLAEPHSFGASPGHSPLNKRRESDTDNSDTANGTCVKKRKPGRPRKCDPNKTTGFTETIWARQTGLLQLSDVAQGKTWVSKAEEAATISNSTISTASSSSSSSSTTSIATATAAAVAGNKLAGAKGQAAPLAPLLLDEWSLRRSERIFLSDTSPLPSPNLQPAKHSAGPKAPPAPRDSRSSSTGAGRPAGAGGRGRPPGTGYKQRQRANSLNAEKVRHRSHSEGGVKVKDREAATAKTATSSATSGSGAATMKARAKLKEERKDRDHAKVQKARSLQELTQRVKRKYNKSLCKKPANKDQEEKRRRAQAEEKPKANADEKKKEKVEESDSSSEADNVPLSSLRERATTPEPRSCVISQEELQDGLHVLFFRDSLFYEGVVQAMQPPDIYGVVVRGQRGTRPHICSREEILKDAIMAVAPGSQRYVSEGTRVCAYWSQQFRCLYPGTVAKTSPNPHVSSVNVEFDDGDSGRIPLSHIRLLPPDFPLVTEEPDPVFCPSKRRRRTLSEEDLRKMTDDSSSSSTRRNARAHVMDDTISDDGSAFDTGSLMSNASWKSSSRTRSCREDHNDKLRTDGAKVKDTRAGASLRSGTRILKSSTARRAGESRRHNNDSDEDDSEDDQSSSEDDEEEDEDSSSSEKEKKTSGGKGRGSKDEAKTKVKRGRKKKRDDRAGYAPSRQTWRWDGRSTKRPGMRGKAKKEFYKSITRGSDHLNVGDSAVFVSTGRDHCPYIGRIESLWESWGGQMMVRVQWFYHPGETKGGKQLAHPKGALFKSPHSDENDVQTISHKCHVLSFKEYNRRTADATRKGQVLDPNTYYLAGYYDPTINFMKLEPDVQ